MEHGLQGSPGAWGPSPCPTPTSQEYVCIKLCENYEVGKEARPTQALQTHININDM